MNEEQWLACNDPQEMVFFLKNHANDRKLRLLMCASCRVQWYLLTDPRLRQTVEVMERFSDGLADEAERRAARLAAYAASSRYGLARNVFYTTFHDPSKTLWAVKKQMELIRDLFGNPFRPASINRTLLAWNDRTVVRLAQAAYEERILPAGTLDNTRLLILADALEEAGCTDEQILTHLRGGGEHYRGCWVIDLLLGKK